VQRSAGGLISITGGKLTTYREMAADTVDAVIEQVLARDIGFAGYGRSTTARLPLRGAAGFDTLGSAAVAFPSVGPAVVEHLGRRYGGEARALMAMIQQDPELGAPLVDGLPYVAAEAVFAARHEMARTVDDVLARRTRARIFGRDDSEDAAAAVAGLIGADLGWTEAEADASAAAYRAAVAEERASGQLPETHLGALFAGR
jgi:glycerol-3-phosphate dehydrogenase